MFESFASAPQGTFRCCKSFPCWRLALFGHSVGNVRASALQWFFLLETSCLRHSVGDVRALFVAAVLKGWTRNLLVFESFASAPQGTFVKEPWLHGFFLLETQGFFLLDTSCLRHSVRDVRALFVAAVLKGWTRNLLVFESFARAPQGTFVKGPWLHGFFLLETSFVRHSAGVRGFRKSPQVTCF